MTPPEGLRSALEQFAALLEYPTLKLPLQVDHCARTLHLLCPEAAAKLCALRDFARREPLTTVEELYTRTFELHAKCYPYLGFHLFGDSYQRAVFLSRLNGLYRQQSFSSGGELADHLPVILRFLSEPADGEETAALFDEGLAPAVEKMTATFNGDDNPYGEVIAALHVVLTRLGQDEARASALFPPTDSSDQSDLPESYRLRA